MANDYTKIALQLQKYGTVQGIMKYINKESLIEQHKKQEKGKAVGIDRMTKEEYDENLEENTNPKAQGEYIYPKREVQSKDQYRYQHTKIS